MRLGPLTGTVRVTRTPGGLVASGDLYDAPPPAGPGIPVLPRSAHRAYVRLVALRPKPDGVRMVLTRHVPDGASGAWREDGAEEVAAAALRPVSPALRRAAIRIDRAPGTAGPSPPEPAAAWAAVLAGAGWQVTVADGPGPLAGPAGRPWDDRDLHDALAAAPAAPSPDEEWGYRLLCVPLLSGDRRGVMFDRDAADADGVPRQGAAVASGWRFPDADPWGHARGRTLAEVPAAHMRTALHEIGHAMGLQHTSTGADLMRPTEAVARQAPPGRPFPEGIAWSFGARQERLLAHLPDPWVRPGGVPFGRSLGLAPPLPEPVPPP